MRFASKLEFGDKTHEVSMTAQRLVQRMKKDSIHSGRRPSGLCGAALLLAARMHEYSRTPNDIVRIVKIHESTLRKRLIEFGETPSSALTLDEFMTVDLEAEQDPPAFKAARRKDKERFQKLADSVLEFTELQLEIDAALEKDVKKAKKRTTTLSSGVSTDDIDETSETAAFIRETTLNVISNCLGTADAEDIIEQPIGIRPDIAAMCEPTVEIKKDLSQQNMKQEPNNADCDLSLDDIDDEELDGYIMTENEAQYKDQMWKKLNADYLHEAKLREERLAKEREEGKPDKKKRRVGKKKNIGPSNTAGEAIEKMLQEKKISTKINYDILKSLTAIKNDEVVDETPCAVAEMVETVMDETENIDVPTNSRIKMEVALPRKTKASPSIVLGNTRRTKPPAGLAVGDGKEEEAAKPPTPAVQNENGNENFYRLLIITFFKYNFVPIINLQLLMYSVFI